MCRRQDFRSVRVQCAIVDVLHFCVSRQVSQHRCSRWQVGEHGQEPEAIVRCWYKHCRQGPQTSSVRTQSLTRPQPQDYHRTAYACCNLPRDDVQARDAPGNKSDDRGDLLSLRTASPNTTQTCLATSDLYCWSAPHKHGSPPAHEQSQCESDILVS